MNGLMSILLLLCLLLSVKRDPNYLDLLIDLYMPCSCEFHTGGLDNVADTGCSKAIHVGTELLSVLQSEQCILTFIINMLTLGLHHFTSNGSGIVLSFFLSIPFPFTQYSFQSLFFKLTDYLLLLFTSVDSCGKIIEEPLTLKVIIGARLQ